MTSRVFFILSIFYTSSLSHTLYHFIFLFIYILLFIFTLFFASIIIIYYYFIVLLEFSFIVFFSLFCFVLFCFVGGFFFLCICVNLFLQSRHCFCLFLTFSKKKVCCLLVRILHIVFPSLLSLRCCFFSQFLHYFLFLSQQYFPQGFNLSCSFSPTFCSEIMII